MEFVIKISQFLLSLSLLIVLHELGHFIPAKLFKTKVEKFYLFFDVKYSLFKKKIGDTTYGIGWLPLGGYVKIAGMIDESMDKEQMALPPQPWEFRSKPAWQRLIIMLGGVTVNFILAYIIYVAMSFTYGDSDVKVDSLKDGYWIDNPALLEMGFQTGDKVLAINDTPIINDSDIGFNLISAKAITIKRDGQEKTIDLPEDFLGKYSSSKSKRNFEYRIPFMVGEVADSSLNAKKDLKVGDVITSINGKPLRYYDQIESLVSGLENTSVTVEILREDNTEIKKELVLDKEGKFGIRGYSNPTRFEELGYYDIFRKEHRSL
jgi:regulator of sigma E protease